MNTSEAKFAIKLVHDKITINLRYHEKTTESELATVLLFVQDILKAHLDTEKVDYNLDGEKAELETIIKNPDREILVTSEDDLNESTETKPVTIYINKKNQLIRISMRKTKPSLSSASRDMRELHEILSFDINKLDQSEKHDIESKKPANENLFKAPIPVISTSLFEGEEDEKEDEKKEVEMDTLNVHMGVPRIRQKVPIKDGVSQQKFYLDTVKRSALMDDPSTNYFTLEEVAKHKSKDD